MSPSGCVLDASVAVKLLVEEELSDVARSLLRHHLVSPSLLHLECASAMWKKVRRDVLNAGEARDRLAWLVGLPMRVLPLTDLLPGALSRALQHRHPVYDCIYLEAAARTGLPLVTDDRRLVALAGDGAEVVLLADLPAA